MPKTNDKQLYQCPECGLHYTDKELAKKCEAFCKEYNGCSLEITRLSQEAQEQLHSSQKTKTGNNDLD